MSLPCATDGECAMFCLRFRFKLMDHPKLVEHFMIKIHPDFLIHFDNSSVVDGYISILQLPVTIEELKELHCKIWNHCYSCGVAMMYLPILVKIKKILDCLTNATSKQLKYGLFEVNHVYRYFNLILILKNGFHMYKQATYLDYVPVYRMISTSLFEDVQFSIGLD